MASGYTVQLAGETVRAGAERVRARFPKGRDVAT